MECHQKSPTDYYEDVNYDDFPNSSDIMGVHMALKLSKKVTFEFLSLASNIQILIPIDQYCLKLSNIIQYYRFPNIAFKYCPVLFSIAQVNISAHSCLSCDVVRNIQILSNIA